MSGASLKAHAAYYTAFDDIIDGYFPLQTSLAQLMDRLGSCDAVVTLAHAPIMEVSGLAPDAPVPLNVRAGRAGLIDRMDLAVTQHGNHVSICGKGIWRWFDGAQTNTIFDPWTRLAEPAYLEGYAVLNRADTHRVHAVKTTQAQRVTVSADYNVSAFGNGVLLGPLPSGGKIVTTEVKTSNSTQFDSCDYLVEFAPQGIVQKV